MAAGAAVVEVMNVAVVAAALHLYSKKLGHHCVSETGIPRQAQPLVQGSRPIHLKRH